MSPSIQPSCRSLGDFGYPSGFPSEAFDIVNQWMSGRTAHVEPRPSEWFGFASAWNAVAYRLTGADIHARSLLESVAQSSSPPSGRRFQQDHDLFVFATSALSAVESFHYAMHCVGHVLDSATFRLNVDQDLKFYPGDVRDRFLKLWPAEAVTRAMGATLGSSEYAHLRDMRDTLSHRGTPPRLQFLGGPDTPAKIPRNLRSLPGNWVYDTALEEIGPLNAWLQSSVPHLITNSASFCAERPTPTAETG